MPLEEVLRHSLLLIDPMNSVSDEVQRNQNILLLLFCPHIMSDSLWPHRLLHAKPLCPLLSPGICSNSCPLSQWCYLTISSSATPFSSCPQSSPASNSFPVTWLLASGGQSIRASSSVSVLPVNIRSWFPLGLIGLISLLTIGFSRIFSCNRTLTWLFCSPHCLTLEKCASTLLLSSGRGLVSKSNHAVSFLISFALRIEMKFLIGSKG